MDEVITCVEDERQRPGHYQEEEQRVAQGAGLVQVLPRDAAPRGVPLEAEPLLRHEPHQRGGRRRDGACREAEECCMNMTPTSGGVMRAGSPAGYDACSSIRGFLNYWASLCPEL
jgi:hypothetical protein